MGFLIDYAFFCGLSFLFPNTKNYILLANVAARIVSAVCNYTINCRLVFKEKPTTKSAASYFALAVLILCMNNVVLLVYTAIPGLSLYIAKILTELTLFVTSYLVQKKIIFRRKF